MGAKEKLKISFVEGVIAAGQERLALEKLISMFQDGKEGDILTIVTDSTECIKSPIGDGIIQQRELYQGEDPVKDSNFNHFRLVNRYACLNRAVVHYRPF
jgi:hypothetical protein